MKRSLIALVISVLISPISGFAADWAPLFCYKTTVHDTHYPLQLEREYKSNWDWMTLIPEKARRDPKFFTLKPRSPLEPEKPEDNVFKKHGKYVIMNGTIKENNGNEYLEIAGRGNTIEADNVFLLSSKDDAQQFCQILEDTCKAQSTTYEHVAASRVSSPGIWVGAYPIGIRYLAGGQDDLRPKSELHLCPFVYHKNETITTRHGIDD